MPFRLQSNYAVLSANGHGRKTLGGDEFWTQASEAIDRIGHDWLVTEHVFTESWDYQEIHPVADEFCYVVQGEVTLRLEAEADSEDRSVALNAGSAFLIPRNVWHTAEVESPVRMIFITMGSGTEVRSRNGGASQEPARQ